LGDTVVFDDEVVGLKGEDELAGFGFDEGGDDDERRTDADGGARGGIGDLWRSCGGLRWCLGDERRGDEECESGNRAQHRFQCSQTDGGRVSSQW
jgi:hypothetical protein